MATEKTTAPKASPMDALAQQVATLQARYDSEIDRLEGLVAANKRAAIAAQRRADAAHAKATAAYEKLGMISDTLALVPDQFATAHSRIEQVERKVNVSVKASIEAVAQKVDGAYKLARDTHQKAHTAANEKAEAASQFAHQAATQAALSMITAETARDMVSKLQTAVAKLEVRVFPQPFQPLIKDAEVVEVMDSGNERVIPFDPKGVVPKAPRS